MSTGGPARALFNEGLDGLVDYLSGLILKLLDTDVRLTPRHKVEKAKAKAKVETKAARIEFHPITLIKNMQLSIYLDRRPREGEENDVNEAVAHPEELDVDPLYTGDFAFVTMNESNLRIIIDFFFVSDFYVGDTDRHIDIKEVSREVANITRLANYGLNRLTDNLRKTIVGNEIEIDDKYILLLSTLTSSFVDPRQIEDVKNTEYIYLAADEGAQSLNITLTFTIEDKEAYLPSGEGTTGGEEFLKAKKSFESRTKK